MAAPINILFKTNVGSHMWGMNHAKSDVDIINVYQQDTKEILSGYPIDIARPPKTVEHDGKEYDHQFMEIGHLINLLLKGNPNAIWAVTSPIIIQDSQILEDLKGIVHSNLSKASYMPIRGMAKSQYLDQEKRKGAKNLTNPNKAFKATLRTLAFGIELLNTGRLKYLPIQYNVMDAEIAAAFLTLDNAYASSKLPEKPNEQVFRQFLYEIRIGKREP